MQIFILCDRMSLSISRPLNVHEPTVLVLFNEQSVQFTFWLITLSKQIFSPFLFMLQCVWCVCAVWPPSQPAIFDRYIFHRSCVSNTSSDIEICSNIWKTLFACAFSEISPNIFPQQRILPQIRVIYFWFLFFFIIIQCQWMCRVKKKVLLPHDVYIFTYRINIFYHHSHPNRFDVYARCFFECQILLSPLLTPFIHPKQRHDSQCAQILSQYAIALALFVANNKNRRYTNRIVHTIDTSKDNKKSHVISGMYNTKYDLIMRFVSVCLLLFISLSSLVSRARWHTLWSLVAGLFGVRAVVTDSSFVDGMLLSVSV